MTSSPLAQFEGGRPPAPAWFDRIVAHAPERSVFPVDGAQIELLTWGEAGRPGLLFLHGNYAHAHWWGFVAPFFATTHRCAAISWSGMGGSDWRAAYSVAQYAQEARAAIDAAGLDRGPVPPVAIAHSFGGAPLLHLAAREPALFAGLILVDALAAAPSGSPPRHRPGRRAYASEAEAVARFRLVPDQPCTNLWALDYLARHAVAPLADGAGWGWRFDPAIWATLRRGDTLADAARCTAPALLLTAERDGQPPSQRIAATRAALGDCPAVEIPQSHHHIMIDQPLALVAALRTGLATLVPPPVSRSAAAA